MGPSQADSREHQQQAIDAEIKSLEDSIRRLRYRRNALAHISALPIEVIEGIFSYLRVPTSTLSTFTPGERPEKRGPLAWLLVAHVCHQWREIALNHPLFWSHVDFSNVSWAGATEILSRAKNAPLYLEARIPEYRWNNIQFVTFQEELQRRVSNTRHLGISAIFPHLYKTLQALVSPAPILEQLSLATEGCWLRPFPPFHETLFNGVTPRLSRLKLCNCSFSLCWKSPILRGLTHLEIRSPFWSTRPELAFWLDSLEEMSHLKTLILHSASPTALIGSSPPFDVKRTIKLPFLTRLDISTSPRDCALALAHLDLPVLAHLSVAIRSRARGGDDPEVLGILPYVTLHTHGPQDTQPLHSMLVYTSGMRFDMQAWPVPNIDFDVRDSSFTLDTMLSARVSLSITNKRWSSSFNIGTRTFDAVLAALPLDNLLTLTAPDHVEIDKQVWRSHAQKWRRLHCIRLGVLSALQFREILLEDNGKHECPLFPSLIKLVLVDSISISAGRLIRAICDIHIKRAEQGVPLKVVDMRAYNVPDRTALQQLSALGVEVWGPTHERSKTLEPSFTVYYCGVRDLLDQDNSDLDSDVDEDGDGLEEGSGSDMDIVVDD